MGVTVQMSVPEIKRVPCIITILISPTPLKYGFLVVGYRFQLGWGFVAHVSRMPRDTNE